MTSPLYKRKIIIFTTLLLILINLYIYLSVLTASESTLIDKITFGSCLHQDKPQPIWQAINRENSDVFIFLGDNIYSDSYRPSVMKKKYNQLSEQKGYQQLTKNSKVLATWDDHDYGKNDDGAENPIKEIAQQIFQDFFNVEPSSPSRSNPGIYQSYYFNNDKHILQIILLDTRFFRTQPIKLATNKHCPHTNYGQQTNSDATILGEKQWQWLEQELKKPATIRVLASSIQIIPEQHCWEKWANFPLEKQKLFNLINKTEANNIIFISGDRHLAEISKIDNRDHEQIIYEVTSSGMNTKMYGEGEINRYRISEDNIRENNYGVIDIDWNHDTPKVSLVIKNDRGKRLYNHDIWLQE